MISHVRTDSKFNLTGSLWMILAMLGFALEDALIKSATLTMPVWQVLVLFGIGGTVLFALWALVAGRPILHADVLSRPMKIRVLFEVLGRLFYVLALALTPLSSATVILQAAPLVVVAGAALFLGETVGWRRWSAILLGMAGVVTIIQPTGESFSVLSVLALFGMLGFAGRDLASRAAPATLSTQTLGFYGFLSIAVAGLGYRFWEAAPALAVSAGAAAFLAGAVVMGVIAYAALMKAMRTGEISAVTPFRYTRLLFGIGLGMALFNERPDQSVWLGSALIVVSGLYILWRGRRA